MNQNVNNDYSTFGGWLLVFYWCSIVGGALVLLTMALPALIGIAASFLFGPLYGAGILLSVATSCASAVFFIKSAIELKARKTQFFDTLVLALLINVCGGILSNLLTIRGVYGVGSFITSTIFSIIFFAIGVCLYIMYFSKSVRVKAYFDGRPLQNSRYWNWIKLLPNSIISENMPDPSKMQQMGSTPQQPNWESQNMQQPPTAQTPPVQPPPIQTEEKPSFCGECGTKNESGAKFCVSCGKPTA